MMKHLMLVVLAILILQASPVHAMDTILVLSTSDGPDVNPGDGNCADSNGDCGLRAAVMEANALPGADDILMITQAGNPTWFIFSQIVVTDPVTISGASPSITRIDAQGGSRIFVVESTQLTLDELSLRNGNAGISNGGAIYFSQNSADNRLFMTDVVIRDSTANNGGGIYGLIPFMTVHHSIIEDNSASAGGGGISNTLSGSTTLMSNTIIRNNSAGSHSGGASILGAQLSDMAIYGNTAGTNGGGIRILGGGTMTQVTISGNSADTDGGGLWLSTSDLQLNNVTITDNSADDDNNGSGTGGGVFSNGGTVTFRNSIIAGNTDNGTEDAPDCSGPDWVSEGYNILGYVPAACNLSGDTANDLYNTTLPAFDPDLGVLQFNDHDNNGVDDTLPTHEPNVISPAINWGNPSGCRTTAAPPLNLINEDQRGADRHQQGRCDAGAAESSYVAPTAIVVSEQGANSQSVSLIIIIAGVILFTVTMLLPKRKMIR